MHKSIKLFLILVVVIFFSDRVISYTLTSLEREVSSGLGVGKLNHFFQLKDSVDILVFGNSRASHHVNLSGLEKSNFNIGVDGTDVSYTAALIKTLKKKNQLVLVHIDHNSLYKSSYKGEDAKALMYKLNDSKKINNFYQKYFFEDWVIAKVFRLYPYNGKFFPILKNRWLGEKHPWQLNGYEPLVVSEKQKVIFNKIRSNQPQPLNVGIEKPLKINPLIDEFINVICNTAKENSSRLVFFTSPSLSKVDAEVIQTTDSYFADKNIVYLDNINFFSENPLNENLWKDYTHLSNDGANFYSEHLWKELQEYY
ncbi:MAG: hypothetical protein AAGC43_00730 [Bacteroidota bacterium]